MEWKIGVYLHLTFFCPFFGTLFLLPEIQDQTFRIDVTLFIRQPNTKSSFSKYTVPFYVTSLMLWLHQASLIIRFLITQIYITYGALNKNITIRMIQQ